MQGHSRSPPSHQKPAASSTPHHSHPGFSKKSPLGICWMSDVCTHGDKKGLDRQSLCDQLLSPVHLLRTAQTKVKMVGSSYGKKIKTLWRRSVTMRVFVGRKGNVEFQCSLGLENSCFSKSSKINVSMNSKQVE